MPVTPLPVQRLEIGDFLQREPALFRGGDDGGGEGMLARTLEAGAQRKHRRLVEALCNGHREDHARFAFGQGAGLVDDQRVDRLESLQRLGILDEHAGSRALADADHDRHRRRKAERAGAGDDEHRDGGDQRIGESRRRAPDQPGDEGDGRGGDDRGHEPGRDRIGEALDRRAAALRLGDHLHDARQHGLGADLLGAHHQSAGAVDRAADELVARRFLDRQRFAGDHRLIDRARAVEHAAIDRHGIARPHAQAVAMLHAVERDIFIAAVGTDAARHLRREVEQSADRAARAFAGAQLQHLAEQDEHRDDGGRFVIDRDHAAVLPEARREQARRESRGEAVEIGGAGAERDQREHVERAVPQDAQPRAKNGAPAQSTTGEAKRELQPDREFARDAVSQCPPISSNTTGSARTRPIQKRRVISTSSGLGPASGAMPAGSSAMPQIGQVPGLSRRISGCIGQVQIVPGRHRGG